jgi:hypothetical protein
MPKTITLATETETAAAIARQEAAIIASAKCFDICRTIPSAVYFNPATTDAQVLALRAEWKQVTKAGKLTFMVQRPDGTIATRKSGHAYRFAVVYTDGHVTFHHDQALAQAALNERTTRWTKAGRTPHAGTVTPVRAR